MLVSAQQDDDVLFVARGAPRRWWQQPQPFGIDRAPTRFGQVSFTMVAPSRSAGGALISGSVALRPLRTAGRLPIVAVHIRSPSARAPIARVDVVGVGASLLAWHPGNETAWFALAPAVPVVSFNFTATW